MSRIARAAKFATNALAQSASALETGISLIAPDRYLKVQTARYRSNAMRAQMGYDAAGRGRRNKYLHGRSTSANAELSVISRLRDNHRELVRNNPYAASAVRVLTNNLVGSGLLPRVICEEKGELDHALQKRIKQWADSTSCDYDSMGNLYSLQSLVVRAVMVSGYAIVIPVYTRDPNNPLKLRVLEGDYIDHSKNGDLGNNTYAVLGVVFNSKHERIGYYIHKTHPGESSGHYTESF